MKIKAEKSSIRDEFYNSTAINRTKQTILQQIVKAEKYRVQMLKNVQIFGKSVLFYLSMIPICVF